METISVILFTGMIVSACIIGGATYSGLVKLVEVIGKLDK